MQCFGFFSLFSCLLAQLFVGTKSTPGGQNMTGTFPEDLAHLSRLTYINFAWNELEGTLPSLSSRMKPITNIELQYNYFSGTIPSDLFQFENLLRVNLAANR